MNPFAELHELLALLYSAPLEPENWNRFINRVCDVTDARLGVLLSGDPTRAQIDTGGGASYDETLLKSYNSQYFECDPYRNALFRQPQVGVVHSDGYLPRHDLRRSQYYNEFLAPFGLECTTIATFTAAPSRLEVFSLVSSRNSHGLIAESAPLMEALLPHLRTACGLRRVLVEQGARAQRAESALDRVAIPVFLLDCTGKLRYQNCAATELARRTPGVRVRDGRLRVWDNTLQSQLDGLIAQAAAVSGAIAGRPGGALLLPRAGKQALLLRVVPLRSEDALGSSTGSVLVLITDPDQTVAHPSGLLRVLYGFTASETEIANHLCAGLTLEGIAELRHVSVGTVRTQIKQLMHKAGVRRQAELMRLMLMLPRTVSSI